jgi:hypothetical protein
VDNYLGFERIDGQNLRDRFINHARSMGVEIYRTRVDNIYENGDDSFMLVAKSELFQAQAVIIATGVSHASYLPGERDFTSLGCSRPGMSPGDRCSWPWRWAKVWLLVSALQLMWNANAGRSKYKQWATHT